MPNLGPETYSFRMFVHYDGKDSKRPELIVYWDTNMAPNDQESQQLHKHSEDEDLESTLIVSRNVAEDAFHRSTKQYRWVIGGKDGVGAQSAIDHLQQIDPTGIREFVIACWTAAWGKQPRAFPIRFPASA